MEPAVRERLLEATLLELEEKGRDGLALEVVLGQAEVSEAEFAAEYDGVEGCLIDAYQQLTERLDVAVRLGCNMGGGWPLSATPEWPAQVRGGLEALLAELAGSPELARALTRTFPSIGPEQQARYQAFVESFGPMLAKGREFSGAEQELPGEVEMLAVGAAEAIVFEEVESGRAAELGAMGPSILFSLLVPFLGPGGAAAEMEKARQGG
jgi:hypothetical protein